MTQIPLHCIVVIIGPSKSGKTTWAQNTFPHQEIISADQIRLELTGDISNHTLNHEVWHELYHRAELRIKLGQRAVIDSTNLKVKDRRMFIDLAKKYGVDVFYVVIDRPLDQIVVECSKDQLYHIEKSHQVFRSCESEIRSGDKKQAGVIDRSAIAVKQLSFGDLPTKLLAVGDVHGNMRAMTQAYDYAKENDLFVIWLGDVVDYGDHNLKCMRLAYDSVKNGRAAMIWGNHERKIDRWITSDWGLAYRGRLSDANLMTTAEIDSLSFDRRTRFLSAWNALRNWSFQHLVVGDFLFTHGAASLQMWDIEEHRLSGIHSNLAFFGQVDDTIPMRSDGYPNRVWKWVDSIPQGKTVVVGHDWIDRVTNCVTEKTNANNGRVLAIDCGSSKGGRLASVEINVTDHTSNVRYFDD